jgi:hypothetical protein
MSNSDAALSAKAFCFLRGGPALYVAPNGVSNELCRSYDTPAANSRRYDYLFDSMEIFRVDETARRRPFCRAIAASVGHAFSA